MTDPSLALKDHTLILTRQKLGLISDFSNELLDSIGIEQSANYLADRFAFMLRAHVLGEVLPSHEQTETAYVSVFAPASWWQHFKEQYAEHWFMRALVKRRPVRVKARTEHYRLTARWDHMAAYPWMTYRTPTPDCLGQPVLLRWATTELEREGVTGAD